ncbi:MAG TPA: PTS sugar transporter subunit IIC [Erysipelotrichaceae bacterium]|nr:PTS sugar transporter subunit IIC [Erysipelotrichaceae bacterium]
MQLWQALLIALLGYFGVNRVPWFFGQSGGFNGIAQPIVACTFIGALFGNVSDGLAVGVALQAMYLGVIQPGGALPSDRGFATFIGGSLAIASGTGVEGAIALAVPLGLLGAALFQLLMTFNSIFPHMGDKATAEGNRKGIVRAQLLAQIPTFLIYVTIYTVANYYGVELVQNLIAVLPPQVTKALSIMARILPAVGFAMLLKYIITPGKEWMLAFFLMGFVLIKNTSFNIVSLTLFGIGMAVMYVMARYGGEMGEKAVAATEGGDDYDE